MSTNLYATLYWCTMLQQQYPPMNFDKGISSLLVQNPVNMEIVTKTSSTVHKLCQIFYQFGYWNNILTLSNRIEYQIDNAFVTKVFLVLSEQNPNNSVKEFPMAYQKLEIK
ncbi:hypothetical protein ABEB36_003700 [Hypothenemus hampei]|uniref:Uncharacterized protein n=1 Tax=Hypothenemus hampei TaxID=57062 RepID=A0ABD1F0U4_HYPHA